MSYNYFLYNFTGISYIYKIYLSTDLENNIITIYFIFQQNIGIQFYLPLLECINLRMVLNLINVSVNFLLWDASISQLQRVAAVSNRNVSLEEILFMYLRSIFCNKEYIYYKSIIEVIQGRRYIVLCIIIAWWSPTSSWYKNKWDV